jgi:hypothetical protein
MDGLVGALPGGYWDAAGQLHREFELAVLTGREEELLAQARREDASSMASTASTVTTVLTRCVRRLGSICPLPAEVARGLLVADRQYLLLALRQATFGDRVRADLFCPWPDCGQRVSLEFAIGDVPVTEAAERAPSFAISLSEAAADGADRREVIFRLPNGADQEAVSPLLAENEAQALTRLLARCIQRIGPAAPSTVQDILALSPLARSEIEAEMARLAPKVEQELEATCAACGRNFVAPFDVQRFFFGELRTDSDLLYREVHYLAYHYHWSEREIMEMTRDKRRRYIEVLADEIERLNDAA